MVCKKQKQKRCKSCGEMFSPISSLAKVCSMPCSLDYAREGAKKKKNDEFKALKIKAVTGDMALQHKLTQAVFNKLRRLQELKWFRDRGMEPTCISCGGALGGDVWCAGHFKTRGAQSGLRYDPKNVFLQHNRRCNSSLSGDIYGTKTTHGYIQGLKNRFGDAEGQAIIDYCDTHTDVKRWACDELIAMRKEWAKQIRELEK